MTTDVIILFLLPLIGGIITFFIKEHNKRIVELILTFSGAYLFSLSLIHLLPELFMQTPKEEYFQLGIYILIGFFLQLFLDFFSQGVEHGHIHVNEGSTFLFSIFFGLSMHSILEGLPLGLDAENSLQCTHHGHDHGHGNALLYGIIIHKIPAAFILGILLKKLKLSKWAILGLLVLFCSMSPIGMGLAQIVEQVNTSWLNNIMAIVIGSFFHISTTILFESSTKVHKFGWYKITSIILGFILALLTLNH